ncbi:hypothetical protein TNCV_3325921 [Trichonephila clavipes]|nr:hypothetical protein TNCV_3325921 [Trichonephila clavipes]
MATRSHQNIFACGRMIDKLEDGCSLTSVAQDKSVVPRFGMPSKLQLIRREVGSRIHPTNIREKDRWGGLGELVLRKILLNGRMKSHIFDSGSHSGNRPCYEIILPNVHLLRGGIGQNFG